MSRESSELTSSLLFDLGKGTMESQIPVVGRRDVPRVKGEPKGFMPPLSVMGFPCAGKKRPRVYKTPGWPKIVPTAVRRVLLNQKRNGKSSSVSDEYQLRLLRNVPGKAWSENNASGGSQRTQPRNGNCFL